jgi:hypothetical protein
LDDKRILRRAIVAQWFLVVWALTVGLMEESKLPVTLQLYLALDKNAGLKPENLFFVIAGTILLAGYIAASISLFLFRWWARGLYLWTTVLTPLLMLLLGPIISTPLATVLKAYSVILVGFTVGLLYFSPAKESFHELDS